VSSCLASHYLFFAPYIVAQSFAVIVDPRSPGTWSKLVGVLTLICNCNVSHVVLVCSIIILCCFSDARYGRIFQP